MKLLESKTRRMLTRITRFERYDLNELFSDKSDCKGLIICYLLASEAKLITLSLEAEHEEIGVPLRWYRRYDNESFSKKFFSLLDFLIEFDYDDFGIWHLKIVYENIEVGIGGNKDSSIIGLSFDADSNLDISPLLNKIEIKSSEGFDHE